LLFRPLVVSQVVLLVKLDYINMLYSGLYVLLTMVL